MHNAQCKMQNAKCRDAARRVISQAEKISRRLLRWPFGLPFGREHFVVEQIEQMF